MEVNLATRPAHAVGTFAGGAGWPEVFIFFHPLDSRCRQLDVAGPNLSRLVVVFVNCDTQAFRIDAEPLLIGEKLPGPIDRFAFEVVAKTEIAQHLEKGVVISRAAHIVDVARAEALLASGGAGEVELYFSQKVIFELIHACRREQHAGIPGRHKHVARLAGVALGLEESEVLFAEFVSFHGGGARGQGPEVRERAGSSPTPAQPASERSIISLKT